jgi:ribosomal protein L12E/L44/L45/RPP1/RPP2
MDSSSGSTPPPPPAEGGKRSKWMAHVKATMKANKGKSLKQVLKMAGKTYKKSARGGMAMSPAAAKGGKRGKKTRRNSRK